MKTLATAILVLILASVGPLRAEAARKTVIYSFQNDGTDGANPHAALLKIGETLYGTTQFGGDAGYGTIYAVTISGTETVLHSFNPDTDGGYPASALINVNGILFGTSSGGPQSAGTVFSVTQTGAFKVVHAFSDRANSPKFPGAGLLKVGSALYGTTSSGGRYKDFGTVFRMRASGKMRILHSFNLPPDGGNPECDLIDVNGTLYGTTPNGGTGPQGSSGTVFSVTTGGVEAVLNNFQGGHDGRTPRGGLVNVNGMLYGTTLSGGHSDHGTVFEISPSGINAIIYEFEGGADGSGPNGDLVNVNGTLYGTTLYGGNGCGVRKCGTVFKISTSGAEEVIYEFKGGTDGSIPNGGLISFGGKLYGTTYVGGTGTCKVGVGKGCGTVFAITP